MERIGMRGVAMLLACAGALAGRGAPKTFLESGRLELGANYWSSYNATKMWREWRPDEIEKDLVALKEHGMTTLRVFPTWSDFQPIVEVHANCSRWNKSKDTRMTLDENVRPQTEAGYSGVPKIADGWKVVSADTDDETDVKWQHGRLELDANAAVLFKLTR